MARPVPVMAAVCAALLGAPAARSQEFDQGPVFVAIEENDLVVDTDRHYTQGLKFSFLTGDNHLPGWMRDFSDWLPSLGYAKRSDRVGTEVGQSIYTPGDISVAEPIPNDRPYAGWLYTGFILQRRGLAGSNVVVLENLQLDLGVIGPSSLAEQAQTWIHELRGFALPQGWDNQLHDEPGVALKFARLWRLSLGEPGRRYFDFIPGAGFSLGNVETSLRAGASLRVGWNLPDDFGVQTISSLVTTDGGWSPSHRGGRWGCYLFAGGEGWLVGYTAFLDGNLFRESQSVDRNPFVAEMKAGAVLVLGRAELGFVYVYRTQEFTSQVLDNGYGSAYMKIKF